jgi:capsular polysaccharide biosynthesis protein
VRSTSPVGRRGWQDEQRDDFLLSELLYILWGRRLLVAGTVLVLVLLALLYGLSREPVYTAEAVVNVEPREELSTTEEREAFMEELRGDVVTGRLMRGAVRRAEWGSGVDQFTEQLEVEPFVTRNGETGLQVRFSGSQPEQAARAANAYAEVFVERVERLNDERLAGGALAADASVERRAASPEGSGLRLLMIYAGVAAGVGLLAGGAGALLLESRARSWRDARDAELTLRAPVLGVIPDYSSMEER